ncbi:hypothetical protein Tco_0291549 [Tanacetum coccineum]
MKLGEAWADIQAADVILGIRIKHESNEISISQSHYIEKVLKKFNYFYCTPESTHMDTSEKLRPNNVGKLSRYTSNPSTQHWQKDTLMQVGSATLKTILQQVAGYSCLGEWGGAISWASKKQTCITSLTMESEFVALASADTLAKAYSQMYNGKSRHLGVMHNMFMNLS